jgi:hypothetical protein
VTVHQQVRARDGHRCTQCGMSNAEHVCIWRRSLDVHRLDPDGDYTPDNCVSLCKVCHGGKSRKRGPRQPRPRTESERLAVSIPADMLARIDRAARASLVRRCEYIRMAVLNQLRADA